MNSYVYTAQSNPALTQLGIILVPSLRIREIPGKEDSSIIGGLFLGDIVEISSKEKIEEDVWVKVRHIIHHRKRGWVREHYVGLTSEKNTTARALFRAQTAIEEKLLKVNRVATLLETPIKKIKTTQFGTKEFALGILGAVGQNNAQLALVLVCRAMAHSNHSKVRSRLISVANLINPNDIIVPRQASKQLNCQNIQTSNGKATLAKINPSTRFLIYRELWQLLY